MERWLEGLSWAAVLTAAWAGVKWLLGALHIRRTEKVKNRNQLLRDDVQHLVAALDQMVPLAREYYAKQPQEGKAVSQKLKLAVKDFASEWHELNKRLLDAGLPQLSTAIPMNLRQCLTSHLDSYRRTPWAQDDVRFESMAQSVLAARQALNALKYQLV